MRLKSRKAELKQQDKISLAKYVGMFHNDCSYNIRIIVKTQKPHIFRIPKNQNITNTPLKGLNFSISVKGIFN